MKLNHIYVGDCIEVMSKELPDDSVDLVVTSPPYNLRNTTGHWKGRGFGGFWAKGGVSDGGYDCHDDMMDEEEYVQWQRTCLGEMMRVLKPDGAIFYNHIWRVQLGQLQRFCERIVKDFPVRQIIVWERTGGINFNPGYFLPVFEVVYLICYRDFKLAPGMSRMSNVWKIAQEKQKWHPAPFPLALAKRCIRSTDAQVILDPFMGSGTVAVAARALGRDYIGIDLSPEYVEKANQRLRGEEIEDVLQDQLRLAL